MNDVPWLGKDVLDAYKTNPPILGLTPFEMAEIITNHIDRVISPRGFEALDEMAAKLGDTKAAYIQGFSAGITAATDLLVKNNLKVTEQLKQHFPGAFNG